jgi:hypothetical protein
MPSWNDENAIRSLKNVYQIFCTMIFFLEVAISVLGKQPDQSIPCSRFVPKKFADSLFTIRQVCSDQVTNVRQTFSFIAE